MSTVRLRRLHADFNQVRDYISRHPRLQLIQVEGDPPERYQLEYRINSLRQRDGELQEIRSHLVEIALPRNYPRNPPQCRMLTPIFHPNIAPHAICIGDHWSAGEPLCSLVARIGELIAYQSYNTKSPLNGEAARWVDQNLARLPLDPVSMIVEESGPGTRPPIEPSPQVVAPQLAAQPAPQAASPAASPAPPPPATAGFACPGCDARIRLTPDRAGKRVRCPRCGTIFALPANG